MYIWIGINVSDQLLTVGEKARQIENEIGFVNSNFTLPLHVSLKISFPVEDALFDFRIKRRVTQHMADHNFAFGGKGGFFQQLHVFHVGGKGFFQEYIVPGFQQRQTGRDVFGLHGAVDDAIGKFTVFCQLFG